jgi:hypothetical protein
MCEAYIYKADIYCEPCGEAIRAEFRKPARLCSEDSDEYPQGPYSDGGGEADSPQHCASCGTFLANPLTEDGRKYVEDSIREHHESGRGRLEVVAEWQAHYGIYPYNDDGEVIEL